MIIIIKVGDYVTRNSYGNDILFQVTNKIGNICKLTGVELRLIADSEEKDLVVVDKKEKKIEFKPKITKKLDRSEYFYIPGKILHIDADNNYLERCMKYYKENNVYAYGKTIKESEIPSKVKQLLMMTKPDILVITGHDAYNKKNTKVTDPYKNSANYAQAVEEARTYEKNHENLVIIAGACQSDYERLLKAGSTFASSPQKINIHALDPAIVATSISLSEKEKYIDLKETLSKTMYKEKGIGGLKSKGMMETGYPRDGIK